MSPRDLLAARFFTSTFSTHLPTLCQGASLYQALLATVHSQEATPATPLHFALHHARQNSAWSTRPRCPRASASPPIGHLRRPSRPLLP